MTRKEQLEKTVKVKINPHFGSGRNRNHRPIRKKNYYWGIIKIKI